MPTKRPMGSKDGCEEKEAIRKILGTMGLDESDEEDDAVMATEHYAKKYDSDSSEDDDYRIVEESSSQVFADHGGSGSVAYAPSPPSTAARDEATVVAVTPGGVCDQKGYHNCSACRAPQKRSQFMISNELNPGLEWQGELWGLCLECYNQKCVEQEKPTVTQKWFENKANRLWKQRRRCIDQKFQAVRSASFKGAKKEIAVKAPGEKKKQFRRRILEKTALVAMKIALAIKALFETKGPAEQEEAREAMETFQKEWEHKKTDIDYVPKLHELAEICQFQADFLPGLQEHWLCRYKDCRLIVMPGDWVSNVRNGGGHYRCPACGRQYSPWVGSGGRCKANKIWVLRLKNGTFEFVPVVWADTTLENLITRFKLIMDPELKKLTDMDPETRFTYIYEYLNEAGKRNRPLYMQHAPFSTYAQQVIDQKNATGTEAQFDYEHVYTKGFLCKKIDEDVNLDELLDQDDLLRSYGLSKVFENATRKVTPRNKL